MPKVLEDIKALPSWVWLGGAAAVGLLYVLHVRGGSASTAAAAPAASVTGGTSVGTPVAGSDVYGVQTAIDNLQTTDQSILSWLQNGAQTTPTTPTQTTTTNPTWTANPANPPTADSGGTFDPVKWAEANPGLPVPGATVNGVTPGNPPLPAGYTQQYFSNPTIGIWNPALAGGQLTPPNNQPVNARPK